jgi:regulator of cell morphogenesis and NO signaling
MTTDLAPELFTSTMTVGDLVRFWPAAIDLLESRDIRYAINGSATLAAAAEEAGLSLAELLAELASLVTAPPVTTVSMEQLLGKTIPAEHDAIRRRLSAVARRLTAGGDHEQIRRIRRVLSLLASDVLGHMEREERDLMPAICSGGYVEQRKSLTASLGQRILIEFVEHDQLERRLIRLRQLRLEAQLSGALQPAAGEELRSLERLLLRHIHLENNILLPAVVEIEARCSH